MGVAGLRPLSFLFASAREGKFSVAEEKGGKWETVQTVTTGLGTKTMDIDNAAHKIYLPTPEFEDAKPGARPVAKPATFMIVDVGRRELYFQCSVACRLIVFMQNCTRMSSERCGGGRGIRFTAI
jgi:hypothetical protein